MQATKDDQFWKVFSARVAREKADTAFYQTAELGRTKTIISVDSDQALVIYRALDEYIERHSEGSEDG